jgi:hypothetical protein
MANYDKNNDDIWIIYPTVPLWLTSRLKKTTRNDYIFKSDGYRLQYLPLPDPAQIIMNFSKEIINLKHIKVTRRTVFFFSIFFPFSFTNFG